MRSLADQFKFVILRRRVSQGAAAARHAPTPSSPSPPDACSQQSPLGSLSLPVLLCDSPCSCHQIMSLLISQLHAGKSQIGSVPDFGHN